MAASTSSESLADRMRTLATTGVYTGGRIERRIRLTNEQKATLAELADKLDERADIQQFVGDDTSLEIRRLLGSWARARRYWCNLTGEPLIG